MIIRVYNKDIKFTNVRDVYTWCETNFGAHQAADKRWGCYGTFWSFKHEKDAMLFTLRWS